MFLHVFNFSITQTVRNLRSKMQPTDFFWKLLQNLKDTAILIDLGKSLPVSIMGVTTANMDRIKKIKVPRTIYLSWTFQKWTFIECKTRIYFSNSVNRKQQTFTQIQNWHITKQTYRPFFIDFKIALQTWQQSTDPKTCPSNF